MEESKVEKIKCIRHLCCVPGCDTRMVKIRTPGRSVYNATGVTLCLFPKEKEALEIWLSRIGLKGYEKFTVAEIRENLRVCIKHFSSNCIVDSGANRIKRMHPIKYGSLPTLHLPNFNEEPTADNSFIKNSGEPDIIDITPIKPKPPGPPTVYSHRVIRHPVPKFTTLKPTSGPPPIPDQLLPAINDDDVQIIPDSQPNDPLSVKAPPKNTRPDEVAPAHLPPLPETPPGVDRDSEEFCKLQQMFQRVLHDRPPPPSVLKRKAPSEADGEPAKKRLAFKADGENESFDKFIIESFNSAEILASNAFVALNHEPQPPVIPDHAYGSSPTIDLLKSSAHLCDFNERKLKALRELFSFREEEIVQIEEVTLNFVKDVLDNHAVDLVKECFPHVVSSLCKRNEKDMDNKPSEFTTEVKQFVIILLMYSWKAYSTLSTLLNLPGYNDVRKWATSYRGCYPGFTGKSIEKIELEIEKFGRGFLWGCLSVKEVQIKRKIDWDGERFIGQCDLGFGSIDHDYVPEASSALVFYLTVLNRGWKYPVGYCLIDKASPILRANLVIQYILKLHGVGIRIVAIVTDGSIHSYNTFKALGVSLEDVDGDMDSSFPHPLAKQERVRCFVDADDTVLLLSQYIEQKGALVTGDGTLVDWSLIAKAHKFRDSDLTATEAYRRANQASRHELRTIHLKMRKERHPIGRHTTVALAYFKHAELPEFVDALETCLFLENVFQYESMFKTFLIVGKDETSKKFCSGMQLFSNNLKKLITFFGWLKDIKEGLVFNQRRKLPILLILLNLISMKGVTKLTTGRRIHFSLYTSKFTMTNLNDFISEIYSRAGTLPSALEFKTAYQELVENPLRRKTSTPRPLEDHDLEVGFPNVSTTYQYTPLLTDCDNVELFLADKVINSWVVKESQCPECVDIFMGSPTRGYLTEPVEGVTARRREVTRLVAAVVGLTEKFVKSSQMPTDITLNNWIDGVTRRTFEEIVTSRDWFKKYDHFFESFEFGRPTHYATVVKGLIRVFLGIRVQYLLQNEAIKIRFPTSFTSTSDRR